MSLLLFNGTSHQLVFRDRSGHVLGTFPAYNHVDRHAALTHIPDGIYVFIDRSSAHPHVKDPDGEYGTHGILRFDVPGHSGIGVHAGRAHARFLPGPPHWTMGCIRTDDASMGVITAAISDDPLTTIEVIGNDASAPN